MRSKRIRNRGQSFMRRAEPTSKKNVPWGKYLYLTILAGLIIRASLWIFEWAYYIEGTGFLEAEVMFVDASHAGRIQEIACSMNDMVRPGQALVLLRDESPIADSDARIPAAYFTTERRIVEVSSDIAILKQKAARAKKILLRLRAEHSRAKHLLTLHTITRAQLEAIEKQVYEAEFDLDDARSEIKAYQEALASYRRQMQAMQRQQLEAELVRETTALTSASNGVVSAIYKQRGEVVTKGESILKIVNKDRILIKAYFSGEYETALSKGDRAKIRFANGDTETGVIEKIYLTTHPQPIEIKHRFGKTQRFLIVEIMPEHESTWQRILETQAEVFIKRKWF